MLKVEALGDGSFAVVDEAEARCRTYPSGAAAWGHAVWQPFNAAKVLPHASGPRGWFYADSRCGRTSDPRQANTIPLADATPDQVEWARQGAANFIRHMLITDGIEVFTLPEDALAEHDPSDYETDLLALTHDEIHEAAEAAALSESEDSPDVVSDSRDSGNPHALEDYNEADHVTTEELEESLGPWTDDESAPDNPQDDAEQPASESVDTDTGDGDCDVTERLSDSERKAFENFSHMAASAPTDAAREFWQRQAQSVLDGEWVS